MQPIGLHFVCLGETLRASDSAEFVIATYVLQ